MIEQNSLLNTIIISMIETNQQQIDQHLFPSPFLIFLCESLEVRLLVFCLRQPYLVDRNRTVALVETDFGLAIFQNPAEKSYETAY
ncbi:hypothetical protein [Streptococcus sp. Marseille-Q0941]|uniref:hypothetical protein n=1 Tax=Streptococcus sp. Marseille-Q0941 TaxID=2942206 RepID=UPI002072F5B5|nr:hypothetical protein [Streptococcus sp. Marseille-Q0941]